MATRIHMPGYQEAKGSPTQDTSDLFGDDEADTNSESDGFEEVQVPNTGTDPKPVPEVVDLVDEEDEQGDEEDDFLPSRVNKYAPIEAKLGVLIDKGSNSRLGGLSLTECIMPPNSPIDTRFESNMPLQAHKHYNGLLNALVAQVVPGQPRVKYSHTKQVDEFYGDGHGEKTRVTRDEKTGKVTACVRKRRIANLDIHSPKQGVDWRISINLEEPAPTPNGQPAHTRRKDRISYTHQAFKIDLTQVTSSHGGPNQVRGVLSFTYTAT
ncbi:mRNA-capping enzyme subunit beta [Ceratobasidium sp. 395]|nr:mRNA-capping enzyme subunit beta [Ceratobasidium sp. 395]